MAKAFDLIAFFEETMDLERLFAAKRAHGPQQRYLMKRYGLSVSESALFMGILAKQLEGEKIFIPQFAIGHNLMPRYHMIVRDYFILLKKKLLQQSAFPHRTRMSTCIVHPDIFSALMKGELAEETPDPADPFAVLDRFAALWKQLEDRENGDADYFEDSCKSFIAQMSPDNPLAHIIKPFSFPEQAMILAAAVDHIESRRSGVDLHDFANAIFPSLQRRAAFLRDVTQGTLPVITKEVIVLQEMGDNPFSCSPDFTLAPKTRSHIFGTRHKQRNGQLDLPPFFVHRRWRGAGPELFFDKRLDAELSLVARALSRSAEGRLLFEKRLKERGLPTGFTALFHGAPGTGKTAAVHHLARLVNAMFCRWRCR